MSDGKIINLNNLQNASSNSITAEELLQMHPTPWERRGRAIFDVNGMRINLVDPLTLTGVIDMASKHSH